MVFRGHSSTTLTHLDLRMLNLLCPPAIHLLLPMLSILIIPILTILIVTFHTAILTASLPCAKPPPPVFVLQSVFIEYRGQKETGEQRGSRKK